MGNMKVDCGYIFHCPLILNISMPELLPIPVSGRLVLSYFSFKVDELPHPIFHPPD